MNLKRYIVSATTDGTGAATEFSDRLTGRLLSIAYVKPGTGGYDNGVTFAVTLEGTTESVWSEVGVNASKTVRPVVAQSLPTGAASTLTESPFLVSNDRVKFVISSGGAAKVGAFHLTFEGPWGGLSR